MHVPGDDSMSEAQSYRADAQRWLMAARQVVAAAEEMDLEVIPVEGVAIAAADLEGMKEACEEVASRLQAVIDGPPSADRFEDALVAADISLNHAMWHWKALRERLLGLGLWDSALVDDAESPRPSRPPL